MRIDRIQVVDRHRNDLGDLTDLTASIASKGMLHPIVVTQEGRLIAGQRRLEACRSLGWSEVPVTFITELGDAVSLLEMERDENVCRKDMTPSEKIALGRALEALETPKAKERQLSGLKAGNTPRSVLTNGTGESKRYDTREVVAPAVGMSTATYSRAKKLVTAAEDGDEKAADAVAEMDQSGKVTAPFERWAGRKVNDPEVAGAPRSPSETRKQRAERVTRMASEGYSTRQIASSMELHEDTVKNICRDFEIEVTADAVIGKTRRHDSNRIAANTVTTLEGLVAGVELIDYDALDRAEAAHWATSLTDSLRVLNRFAKQIKEMT